MSNDAFSSVNSLRTQVLTARHANKAIELMLKLHSMPIKSPSILYEINTPVFLYRLSQKYGRSITLANIPDEEFQQLAQPGIQTIWLMGVWERSPQAIEIGRHEKATQEEFREVLPDLQDQDVIGSAYSIRNYGVNKEFGGKDALASFRAKLKDRGIGLILDFVPNHTAPDNPWVSQHPEYYVQGSAQLLEEDPSSYIKCGDNILAKGRDPELAAWSDVVQLNAFSETYRKAAINTLKIIAGMCDGVRCDMAMLMLNNIFNKSWGESAGPIPETDFWIEVISAVRISSPSFTFLAETYWDNEQILINQGFDYCYDKTLYDLLLKGSTEPVTAYLKTTSALRNHMMTFIENHDEKRAASLYPVNKQCAAAAILATLPGIWMIHDGQSEGYLTHIPVHLRRGPNEEVNSHLKTFYVKLLDIISSWRLQDATWRFLENSNESVVASVWSSEFGKHIAVINYSGNQTQAILPIRTDPPASADTTLVDDLSGQTYHVFVGSHYTRLTKCDMEPWQILLLTVHP